MGRCSEMKMRTPCIEDRRKGRIKRSFYADFSKLYRFSNMEQRNFPDTYFRRYEITCLKNIVQAILSDSPTLPDVSDYEEALGEAFGISVKEGSV